ncbi:MAG: hypothetical protein ABI388_01530 [Bacteroidia bacterium]
MKGFFTCVLLFFIVGFTQAQQTLDSIDLAWDKTKLLPTIALTISYGAPNLQAKLISNDITLTNYKLQNIGPILMRIDVRTSEKTTVGLCYGYSSYYITNYNNLTPYNVNRTYVNTFGVRLNKYFVIKKHFAFYLGAGAGFCINQYQNTDHYIDDTTDKLRLKYYYLSLIAGFKYKPTKFLNIFIEGGIDRYSIAQAGVSFCIKK